MRLMPKAPVACLLCRLETPTAAGLASHLRYAHGLAYPRYRRADGAYRIRPHSHYETAWCPWSYEYVDVRKPDGFARHVLHRCADAPESVRAAYRRPYP